MSYRKLMARSQMRTQRDLDKYESSIGEMGGLHQAHYGGCQMCMGKGMSGGCQMCGGKLRKRSKSKRKSPKSNKVMYHLKSQVKKYGTKILTRLSQTAKKKLLSLLGMGLKPARKKVYKPLIGNYCPPLSKLRKKELQILAKNFGVLIKDSKKMTVAQLRMWLKKNCMNHKSGKITPPMMRVKSHKLSKKVPSPKKSFGHRFEQFRMIKKHKPMISDESIRRLIKKVGSKFKRKKLLLN